MLTGSRDQLLQAGADCDVCVARDQPGELRVEPVRIFYGPLHKGRNTPSLRKRLNPHCPHIGSDFIHGALFPPGTGVPWVSLRCCQIKSYRFDMPPKPHHIAQDQRKPLLCPTCPTTPPERSAWPFPAAPMAFGAGICTHTEMVAAITPRLRPAADLDGYSAGRPEGSWSGSPRGSSRTHAAMR